MTCSPTRCRRSRSRAWSGWRRSRTSRTNAAAALRSIRQVSTAALADLRSALGVLRDPAAATGRRATPGSGGRPCGSRWAGSPSSTGWWVTAAPTAGCRSPCRRDRRQPRVPLVVDAAAHRIVQESITNVLRHSASAGVVVEVDYRPTEIELRISNPRWPVQPGHRVDPLPGTTRRPGFGIAGMRERARIARRHPARRADVDGGFEVRRCCRSPSELPRRSVDAAAR